MKDLRTISRNINANDWCQFWGNLAEDRNSLGPKVAVSEW